MQYIASSLLEGDTEIMPLWLGAAFVKPVWHYVNSEKGFLGGNSALDLALL